MSDSDYSRLQRAQLLLQTDRRREATRELRQIIADSPEYAPAYALLSQVLTTQDVSAAEAVSLARHAVAIDPEYPYAYYALAFALYRENKYDEVDHAICRAIELDREDPDFPCLRGAVFMDRNRLPEAKRCFLEALTVDPEHRRSLTLLSQVESQLGNVDEAKRLAEQAVRNSPEDPDAHAARGYSFIYSNRPKEAFEAFREALRLDPNDESARNGMLQALKTHHFFYRGLFHFFTRMNRLSESMQWGLIIGFFIGYNILRNIMKQHPEWVPIILPIIILYLLFVFMSWVSEPITYFLLLFNHWGRSAMNARQKMAGIVIALFLPLGILGVLFPSNSDWIFIPAIGMLMTMIPITSLLLTDHPKTRRIYGVYTLIMVGLLLATAWSKNSIFLSLAFLMLIGFQLLVNYYNIRSTAPQ